MAATPQNAVAQFVGRSGRRYNISMYLSDVANAAVTFSPAGKAVAGSLQFWRPPEDVVLKDLAVHTGTADTTTLVFQQDGAPLAGAVFAYLPYLDTIATRPEVTIGFPAGALVGASQS